MAPDDVVDAEDVGVADAGLQLRGTDHLVQGDPRDVGVRDLGRRRAGVGRGEGLGGLGLSQHPFHPPTTPHTRTPSHTGPAAASIPRHSTSHTIPWPPCGRQTG